MHEWLAHWNKIISPEHQIRLPLSPAEWYISGDYRNFANGDVWMECCYVTKLQKVFLK